MHFQSQAANKRGVTINLKSEQGRDVFRKLARTADVIVENFRAGKLSALGLGYEDIRAVKPDIIYCSLTGFGQTGPKREHAAFDNTIQAYSGMMLQTGDSGLFSQQLIIAEGGFKSQLEQPFAN
ncbi:MAG: CoA transferase, partial [Verrucomicrobiota bacterium]